MIRVFWVTLALLGWLAFGICASHSRASAHVAGVRERVCLWLVGGVLVPERACSRGRDLILARYYRYWTDKRRVLDHGPCERPESASRRQE